MINQTTKHKIEALQKLYASLAKGNENLLKEITLAEIPEMVYNSNAIENSTLSLEDTKKYWPEAVYKERLACGKFTRQKIWQKLPKYY